MLFFPESLEQDVKRLKTELQANRQLESELRSQLSSLSSQDRSLRSELGQLRQDNELLQNKWVHTQRTGADITALHNQWHLLTRVAVSQLWSQNRRWVLENYSTTNSPN